MSKFGDESSITEYVREQGWDVDEAVQLAAKLKVAGVDMIARESLRNPYFPLNAAKELSVQMDWPNQYLRVNRWLLLFLVVQVACNTRDKTKTIIAESQTNNQITINMKDTTPKVTGIGGIFFRSKDPEKAKDWYKNNLGLVTNDWGSTFEFRNANRPDEINYLSWSPFDEKTTYFDPSDKEFMINYRVQNLEGLLKILKENGVTIVDDVEVYDYGKFVHIMDPDGNKIELWEPVDHVFTSMGGETTK